MPIVQDKRQLTAGNCEFQAKRDLRQELLTPK